VHPQKGTKSIQNFGHLVVAAYTRPRSGGGMKSTYVGYQLMIVSFFDYTSLSRNLGLFVGHPKVVQKWPFNMFFSQKAFLGPISKRKNFFNS